MGDFIAKIKKRDGYRIEDEIGSYWLDQETTEENISKYVKENNL